MTTNILSQAGLEQIENTEWYGNEHGTEARIEGDVVVVQYECADDTQEMVIPVAEFPATAEILDEMIEDHAAKTVYGR